MRAKTLFKKISVVLLAAVLMTSIPADIPAASNPSIEAAGAAGMGQENLLKLWYDEPVSQGTVRPNMMGGQGTQNADNVWQQLTLPIGNSRMGANVYGEVAEEHLTFNHKTLWNGGPSDSRPNYNGGNKDNMFSIYKRIVDLFLAGEDSTASDLCESLVGEQSGYGAYQSWGDIYLTFGGLTASTAKTNYNRGLDLSTAVANVDFTANGTDYHREYFVSYPDNVLAMKLTARGSNQLNMDVKFLVDNGESNEVTSNLNNRLGKENVTYTVNAADKSIVMSGQMQDNQMKMNSMVKIVTSGTVTKNGDNQSLHVANANEAVIFISADTDYKNEYPTYRTGETKETLAASVAKTVADAVGKGYDEVKKRHLEDYRELFDRVKLDLGQTVSNKTTDDLLTAYNATGGGAATNAEKRLLEVILYQYGRYLTIASSREGDLPSNLQGVWQNRAGDYNRVAWGCDYHMNVNLQMNYWPTYSANLAECATPLIDYVDSLRKPGRVTAEKYFGIKSEEGEENGFTAHTQNTPFGWTCPGWKFSWGWSPAAVPWILQNCWEYYEYTGDVEYMREHIYPMLKEEALLYDQILVDTGVKITLPNGKESTRLVSAPSYSPEWGPYSLGNVYEQGLIWQLYEDAAEAARILKVDTALAAKWKENQSRLAPIEIGDEGQIKEWYNETRVGYITNGSTESKVPKWESVHRHMSHMLGLFPGDLVSVDNQEYMDAAVVSLSGRGDSTTGWGMGQRINAWARTGDGNKTYVLIKNLFRDGIYPNLWDAHPPFQIDGNFGYTSGVNEMMMQSNMGYINILPAIPDTWADGSVDGIVARGNFELKIDWADGKVTAVQILSNNGGTCSVLCKGIKGGNVKVTDSEQREIIVIPDADGTKDRISFETEKGRTYQITGFGEGIAEEKRLAAPSNVRASVSANGAAISWNAVSGADSYNIYRRVNTDFVKINKNPITGTTYTDPEGLLSEENAKYRVAAVKAQKEGMLSAIVTANTTSIKIPVTITFRSEKEINGALPAQASKQSGDVYTLPNCTASVTGFRFAGWSDGRKTYSAGGSYTVPRTDTALTAVWEIDAYQKLPTNGWIAVAGSEDEDDGNDDGRAADAIDNNEATWWHSNYSDSSKAAVVGDPGERNEFTIDFGKTVNIVSLEYVPRSDGEGNGFITGYRLYYSESANGGFTEIGNGGTWAYNGEKKSAEFGRAIPMRRIQIRATETNGELGRNQYIHAAEFNVYTYKDGIVVPTGIQADAAINLNFGENKKLNAAAAPANATYQELTYTSSNPLIASVSKDGTVTAGVSKTGAADITITAFGGATAVCRVTVTPPIEPESIRLDKNHITLKPGEETVLTAVIEPDAATDKTIAWSSDHEDIVTVDNGIVRAAAEGTAKITAQTSNGLTAECIVTVAKAGEAERIHLNKESITLQPGQEETLTASIEPENAPDQTLIWSSEDETIATVENGRVSALKHGETRIVVTTSNGVTAFCDVFVLEQIQEGDKTELAQIVEKLTAEEKDFSVYTNSSVQKYQEALEWAQRVLDTENASQPEIDKAYRELNEAVENLAEKAQPEKIEELRQQIIDAEKKNLSIYTEESVNIFTKALEEAKKLLNGDVSAASVENAMKNLADAEKKLAIDPKKEENRKVPTQNSLIEDANLQYTVTKSDARNGTVTVSGVTAAGKKKSAITIPATVEKDSYVFKVTAINKNVFKGSKKKLKSIVIGANVTEIGANSFYKCSKLKTIRFMGTAAPKKVGKNAFKGIKPACKIFYPKAMNKAEIKKLKKKMKSAGKKAIYKKK